MVVNDLGRANATGQWVSDSAESVAREIRELGGEAIAEGADITQFAHVQGMFARTIDRWGCVDILVNNAGILRDKTFLKVVRYPNAATIGARRSSDPTVRHLR